MEKLDQLWEYLTKAETAARYGEEEMLTVLYDVIFNVGQHRIHGCYHIAMFICCCLQVPIGIVKEKIY